MRLQHNWVRFRQGKREYVDREISPVSAVRKACLHRAGKCLRPVAMLRPQVSVRVVPLLALLHTTCNSIDWRADGIAGYDEFHSAILLTAGRIMIIRDRR